MLVAGDTIGKGGVLHHLSHKSVTLLVRTVDLVPQIRLLQRHIENQKGIRVIRIWDDDTPERRNALYIWKYEDTDTYNRTCFNQMWPALQYHKPRM